MDIAKKIEILDLAYRTSKTHEYFFKNHFNKINITINSDPFHNKSIIDFLFKILPYYDRSQIKHESLHNETNETYVIFKYNHDFIEFIPILIHLFNKCLDYKNLAFILIHPEHNIPGEELIMEIGGNRELEWIYYGSDPIEFHQIEYFYLEKKSIISQFPSQLYITENRHLEEKSDYQKAMEEEDKIIDMMNHIESQRYQSNDNHGYDGNPIDDAFEGDPENQWNID